MNAKKYSPFFPLAICTAILLLVFQWASAQPTFVRVGLWGGQRISTLEVMPTTTDFSLIVDGKVMPEMPVNTIFHVMVDDDSLLLSCGFQELAKGAMVRIHAEPGCALRTLGSQQQLLQGDLVLSERGCFLNAINEVELEDYVSGVVEAEVGPKQPLEYYKVQSVLCRTYALGHLRRHEAEGFNLCDKEHCQVYRGKAKMDETILMGTLFTDGVVMVDDRLQLITAAFHSNCGGQTCNAEDVWNKPAPALRSVRDTFCQSTRNAHWEKEISRKAWVKYLLRKNAFVDSSKVPQSLNFAQPRRRVFYEAGQFIVPLREMRTDWSLRSTFFSVEEAGDKVLLRGRGFGHGIGLCQEGAIRRARYGETYLEILHVYYKGITLMNRRALNFFSEEP